MTFTQIIDQIIHLLSRAECGCTVSSRGQENSKVQVKVVKYQRGSLFNPRETNISFPPAAVSKFTVLFDKISPQSMAL
jgi:hypothetical protein